jgi:phage terminase Nu1 subunit (DNA packaging protein)
MSQGNKADKKGPLVTRRRLAELLDVHMMTVTKWERDGLPVAKRGRKGKPSLYREEAVQAWLFARDQAAKSPDAPLDLAQERAKKERWQGFLAEQTFKVRDRQLIPAAEVEKVWLAEVTAVRAVILASYTADADRVFRAGTLEGVAGVERELKDLAERVLRELADPVRPTGSTRRRGRKKAA